MHAGLIRVLDIHRRSVASTENNDGYLNASQSAVDGSDTSCDGLPVVYLGSTKWTPLSRGNFKDRQARLQLFALPNSLGNPEIRRD